MSLLIVHPFRVQRKRTKGWKMPLNTIYVGRPPKWGNPASVKNGPTIGGVHSSFTAEEAVEFYRDYVTRKFEDWEFDSLRGRNLACWCHLNEPCHADVLLELANQ